jgi:hypothetical protein
MNKDQEISEESVEFRLSKRKFLLNLLKLIPKMKKIRRKAEEIIVNMKDSDLELNIPTSEEIQQLLEQICKFPHRRIGTKNAHEIEDLLFAKFKEFGLESVKKERLELIDWSANNWKLIIQKENEPIEIPCFYVLNTGFTDKNGIRAPLVYVGAGEDKDFKKKDVKDKIVVADIEFPILPIGKLIKLAKLFYVSDPKQVIDRASEIILTFALTNFPPQALGGKRREDSVYWRAFERGALGLVLILRDYPSNVNTHWGPYDGTMIILEGTQEPSFAHNIWGVLPGKSEEMIMISTHHDSAFKGATEDGTGLAVLLAQLQAWAKVPKESRSRSLLFCISAGHLYGGIGAEAFARKYKNTIMKDVLVDLNIEHMCAKEVEEDPETQDFRFTGNLALGATFISRNEHLVAPVIKACRDHEIEHMMLIPDNFFATPPIGEAGHFSTQADIDVIHWIRSPYYLLTAEDTLDKVDMSKLHSTAQCISDLTVSLMNIPTDKLKSKK